MKTTPRRNIEFDIYLTVRGWELNRDRTIIGIRRSWIRQKYEQYQTALDIMESLTT